MSVSLVVAVFLLVEAVRAAGNERLLRARGGVEPPGDVYRVMRWAYPASFGVMIAEGAVRHSVPVAAVVAGVALFTTSKALKWWAILALGPRWTFRVIVVPGAALVRHGPYRFMHHPNYLAVAGELAAVALMTGAVVTGPIVTAAFGALIWKRVSIEERAMGRG